MTTTANAESEKIYFASGTRYRQSEDQITFKDIQKNRQAVSTQSFLHLSNGGTASFAPGVFLIWRRWARILFPHYGTSEQMIVNVGADQNYTIQSGTETLHVCRTDLEAERKPILHPFPGAQRRS